MGKLFEMFKKNKKKIFKNFTLVFSGNLFLAFGTAIFLTKLNIVAGGLMGIGIIFQNLLAVNGQIIDIVVFIATWSLWLIGLIFLGKEFSIKTLASAIIYPIALSIFLRVKIFQDLSSSICYYGISEAAINVNGSLNILAPISNLMLSAIFGGVFIGFGVALNFKGGGSTGGVDVIIALCNKWFGFKESVVSFLIDSSIIVVAMFCIKDNIIPSLCGVLSAFITALIIEVVYVSSQSSFMIEIISEKWETISSYVQDTLGRGATIILAEGGYKREERPILRIVFPKEQYNLIRDHIAKIDPCAFITVTRTNAVFGEGFKSVHRVNTPNKKGYRSPWKKNKDLK